jgi:hypothetical protein
MHTAGIDKIAVVTKEFKVLDGHLLTIQPSAYRPNDPDQKEETILFGNQKGKKAFFNHTAFNTTIDPRGIVISLNPSKALHPYHLTNEDSEIRQVWDYVREEMKDAGILIPPDNELKLARLDMAINSQMAFPIQFYAPLFQSLRGKRMTNKEYPSSYYFSNNQREINFYDKTEEVTQRGEGIPIDPRLMRGELRAKKTDSIGRMYRFNDLETMLKCGGEYRLTKYKQSLNTQIFADGNRQDQLSIFTLDYDRELEIMKMYREKYPRNAVHNWLADNSLDVIIGKFGSLKNLRMFYLDAGLGDKYTFRLIKQMEERINFTSFFQTKNKEENLTNLYNEVFTKFAV